MLKEIKLGECIGKTLKAVALSSSYSNQAVLVFDDGTFTTLGIECSNDPGDERIVEEKLDVFEYDDETLVSVGIVTAEEIATMRAEREAGEEAERVAAQELRDRELYARLKKKYGG